MYALVVTALFPLILTVEAQKFGFGSCPPTQILQGLDVPQFQGRWFEIKKYPTFFQGSDCVEANYGPINDRGQMRVVNKELSNGAVRAVEGFAEQPGSGGGDLKVNLRVPVRGSVQSDYNVLGTDYQSYAVVHTCSSFLGIRTEFAWVLSRTRQLPFAAQQEVDQIIARNGLDQSSFRQSVQENCPDFDTMPTNFIA